MCNKSYVVIGAEVARGTEIENVGYEQDCDGISIFSGRLLGA